MGRGGSGSAQTRRGSPRRAGARDIALTDAPTGDSERAGAARGPSGRVAFVQAQTRTTLAVALAFVVATAIALVIPHHTGWWLPLHLFLAGALLLAISAATQFFAVTWAAGPPASNRTAGAQRWLLATSVLLLVASRELRWPRGLAALGGAGVIVSLLLLGVSLRRTVLAGVQRRFDGALDTYLCALLAGAIGSALGIAMATGLSGSAVPRVRAAHLTLNLLGLVGLVIVATLPFFTATQARVKMSPRADRRAQGVLLGWLSAALATTTFGFLSGRSSVAAAGLVGYAAGLVALVALLPAIRRKQLRWAGPRLLQLGAGVAWWSGATLGVAWQAAHHHPVFTRPVVGALVVGGYAQILAAALAYLGPVLRGGGHQRLSEGFRTTRSWLGLIAPNVAAVGLLFDTRFVVVLAIGAWIVDTAVRAATLVRRGSR
jgi:nitrite reductase (NO-forming)